MAINNYDGLGEVLDALGSAGRIESFDLLVEGLEPKKIPDQMEISRSGLQHHLDKFREQGLIFQDDDGSYQVTPLGESVHEWILEFDSEYDDVAYEGVRRQFEREFEERVGGLNSPQGRKILADLYEDAQAEDAEE